MPGGDSESGLSELVSTKRKIKKTNIISLQKTAHTDKMWHMSSGGLLVGVTVD